MSNVKVNTEKPKRDKYTMATEHSINGRTEESELLSFLLFSFLEIHYCS